MKIKPVNKLPAPGLPAVKAAVAKLGGLTNTARRFNITPQAVYKWIVAGAIPRDRCRTISALTRISLSRLNPKAYGGQG